RPAHLDHALPGAEEATALLDTDERLVGHPGRREPRRRGPQQRDRIDRIGLRAHRIEIGLTMSAMISSPDEMPSTVTITSVSGMIRAVSTGPGSGRRRSRATPRRIASQSAPAT